jgi:hypothetical protein
MQFLRQRMAPQPLQKRLVRPPGPAEALPGRGSAKPGDFPPRAGQESIRTDTERLPYLRPDQIWKIGIVLFTSMPGCGYFSMTRVWN